MHFWSVLTSADVLAQFNDSETSAYDTAKGDTGGTDLADILVKVTDQVRLAYANGGRLLDTDLTTIPDGEKNRAIAIARYKYLLALPTGKALAENRAPEAETAEKYFLAVAKREFKSAGAQIGRPGRPLQTDSFDHFATT